MVTRPSTPIRPGRKLPALRLWTLLLFGVLLLSPEARAGVTLSAGVVYAKARIMPFTDGDGDGLSDNSEARLKTDPANPDSDGDGLTDGAEALDLNTDPARYDSDGDGFSDGTEVTIGSDPMGRLSFPVRVAGTVVYTGVQTGAVWIVAGTNSGVWASARSLGPRPEGPFLFTNLISRQTWSVQAWLDVQADGVKAAWEPDVSTGLFSPTGDVSGVVLELADTDADTDGNGLIDRLEWQWFGRLGVDPDADEDDDSLNNADELDWGTDPLKRDTDGDGLSDGSEVAYELDPMNPATPISVSIELVAGRGILLNWNTQFSQGYIPQYRTDLNSGDWSNLMPHAVYEYDEWPEGSQQLLDRSSTNAPRRFYRVITPDE